MYQYKWDHFRESNMQVSFWDTIKTNISLQDEQRFPCEAMKSHSPTNTDVVEAGSQKSK